MLGQDQLQRDVALQRLLARDVHHAHPARAEPLAQAEVAEPLGHLRTKPSNVVLTPSGRAMLLDFGLASTAESSPITRTGTQVGSLPYLPPECLRRGAAGADHRADVYSLGVSLYEMLALRLPFQGRTIHELDAAIASGTCPALAEVNRSVPWDAATVCATAMERDVARRYPTAAAFARDLRNLLELRPIAARPARRALRARRWVQRHPTATVAAALGFLLVVIAPSVAWWRIRAERDVAVRELRTKDGMLDFMLELFAAADTDTGNPGDRTVYLVVDEGAKLVDKALADAPEVRARLLLDLSVIQSKLGRPRESVHLARQSLALARELWGDHDPIAAKAQFHLGVELLRLGETDEAMSLIEAAREAASGGESPFKVGELELSAAVALIVQGRHAEAARLLAAVAAAPAWEHSASPADRVRLYSNMGEAARGLGELEQAAAHHDRALKLARATHGDVHDDVARTLQNLAVVRIESGKPEAALALLLEALDIRAKLGAGESMEDARLAFNLAAILGKLARPAESAVHFGRALRLCRELAGDSTQTARAAAVMGSALLKAGELDQAEAILGEAVELSRQFIPRRGMAAGEAPLWLARCMVARTRPAEAEPLFAEVLQCIDGDPGVDAALAARINGEHADVLEALGRAEEAVHRRDRQRQLLEEAASKKR